MNEIADAIRETLFSGTRVNRNLENSNLTDSLFWIGDNLAKIAQELESISSAIGRKNNADRP